MANPVIRVILSAVDEVSGVAKKASDGVSGFAEKAKGALGALAALGVGAALGAFFKKTIEEANAAEIGMGRLGQAVTNAGGNFSVMSGALEKTIASVQRVSTATDDELREALTRLVAVSGDVAGSQENLSLVADIAAYKQISLTDAAELVGKAMVGNITAFQKMGVAGKDATQVLENARASFGGFAEEESKTFGGSLKLLSNLWGDFQEAVGVAILSGGQMTGVSAGLADALAGLVSWVEDNEDAFQRVIAPIVDAGHALFDVGKAVYDVVQPALGPLLKLTVGTLLVTLTNASLVVRELAAAFEYTAGKSLEALGFLVEKGGALLKLFGVEVVADAGTSIRSFGEKLVQGSKEHATKAADAWKKGLSDLFTGTVAANTKTELQVRAHGDRVVSETDKTLAAKAKAEATAIQKAQDAREKADAEQLKQLRAIGAQLAAEQQRQGTEANAAAKLLAEQLKVNLGAATARSLELTTAAMEQLLVQLRGKVPLEQWQALNAAVQQHKRDLSDLLPPASSLAEAAKEAEAANKKYGEDLKAAKKSTEELVRGGADLARAFVDAASATGVIDDKMTNVLNSSITLATNIGKAFGGDPTAIAASVTSLANIIVGIGSSETEKRRQAAAASNTQALERLTREVGNLNLRESGKTFAGIQSAVDASIQARADARASGKGPGDADRAAKEAFLKSLSSQGIGLEEARALFKELFGRDLALANAGTFFQDIQAFSKGLQNTEFGQFGKDFEGQLNALTRGFEILGITDADDKLQKFRTLAAKFSPALAEALNVDLSTPEGIAKATENLRALFGKLENGGLSPTEIGVSGNQFLSLISTILPLLGDANGLLGSGLSAGVNIGNGPVGGTPATGGSVPQLGAPGLPAPFLGAPAGVPDAFAASGAAVGTVINGGVVQNITITPRIDESSPEFLERITAAVDIRLVGRRDALVAANGTLGTVG